ncbi:MAG: transcription-repair coupling factor [Clostridia bacterium]|nr:transcription-repair coupling factor [Clostridia bacterium]
MLKDLLLSNKFGGVFNQIASSVRGGVPTAVFGVGQVEKMRVVANLNSPALIIMRDSQSAVKAKEELEGLTGEKVVFLPAKDDVLLYKSAFNKDSLHKRLTALYEIFKGAKIVVTVFEALLQLFPSKINFIELEKNNDYDLSLTIQKLVQLGYKRVEFAEKRGEFAVRGDILEVFPINLNTVVRVDFFGDTVERIRQEDLKELNSLTIVMASDVVIDETEVDGIIKNIEKSYKEYGTLLVKDNAKNLYYKLLDKLKGDLFDDSLQYVAPLLKNVTHDIFSLINKKSIVVFDESKVIYDNLKYIEKEHNERFESLKRTGDALSFIVNQLETSENLLLALLDKKLLALQTLSTIIPFFNPLKTYSITSSPLTRYYLKRDELFKDVQNWKLSNYTVLICCPDRSLQEAFYYEFNSNNIGVTYLNEITENLSGVSVVTHKLKRGFIQHDTKLVVIGNEDICAKKQADKKLKKKRGDLFTAPSVGDFAVHEQFGVGLIRGVKKIGTIEGFKEYVELEYAGGDRLYVSTDQMDKLSKYLGGSENPTLNKIGGGEFERIKARVRSAIAKMTINLKKLYKERKEKRGYQFSEDNELSLEFDNAFEFEETEDQIISIQEIKEDMESGKVMDRLLCGDVGFGKTEVAFRACFKAILEGKQAAIVAPTTILTQQHYMTAINRFEGFGVRIKVLNRFRTKKQQEETLFALKNGDVDLIIGTHRLFSKDVEFKDLGLLVIDEEQRFGVEHKEKLKLLKSNVDTLTLSATPIPRTLNLSLSGIRDISTINTPPKQRIPVQTVVAELTDSLINDAINKELSREGQVFILYNRVDTIYNFAEKVKNIVPEAKVIVAHGQMPEKALEDSISAFYKGECNVLIATTIIENGIDMPRANTLIVEGSDKLGLSTLYQLKGRVGRGNLMAYAYFTYSENSILTDASYKRLSALMEYTEMGSGYKIAMRDLEIRGAGSVLGKEQHGHMDRIGYELYNKLLKEELGESTLNEELELDIKADAYIPDDYIENETARLDAYKAIAEIVTDGDRERVTSSLINNFGKIPKEVLTLIDIACLKVKSTKVEGIKLIISLNTAKLYLKNLESLRDGFITSKLLNYKNKVTLSFEENPVLTFNEKSGKPEEEIKLMLEFLS